MKHFKIVVGSGSADSGTYIARRIVVYDDKDVAVLSTSADHIDEISVIDPDAGEGAKVEPPKPTEAPQAKAPAGAPPAGSAGHELSAEERKKLGLPELQPA